MTQVAFGLGGNVGDVRYACAVASDHLSALEYIDADSCQCSSFYSSPALLPDGAPETWDQPFINQVVLFHALSSVAHKPERLLRDVKRIEQLIGRQDRGHWGPREIDIDIIAIDNVHYASGILTIPHKQAHHRAFVVKPLAEIWPDCVLANGSNAKAMLEHRDIMQQICEPVASS